MRVHFHQRCSISTKIYAYSGPYEIGKYNLIDPGYTEGATWRTGSPSQGRYMGSAPSWQAH